MMKRSMLVFFLLSGLIQSAFAYPIPAVSLIDLIKESKFIVYAEVEDIQECKINTFSTHIAILKIKETTQGEISEGTIEVSFHPGMICPQSARYVIGETVLAFLNKPDHYYVTESLSYGTKVLDQEGFETYRERIIEMQSILLLPPDDKQQEKIVDWHVKCASNNSTKWEGIHELRKINSETKDKKYQLNKSHKQQLRNSILERSQLDYIDLQIVDLFAEKNDKEIIDLLHSNFKLYVSQELRGEYFIARKIAKLSEREDLNQIIDEIEKLDFWDKKRKELIKEAKIKFMKIL